MFLIDCGETVYKSLIRNELLENVDTINIMITHTHGDHIGSLGSLVLYAKFRLNKKINIILPNNDTYKNKIKAELKEKGCKEDAYTIITAESVDNKYESFQNIRYVKTSHTPILMCYSIIFNTKDGLIYYSGDTAELDVLLNIINSGKQIYRIYIDTSTNIDEANVHLQLGNIYDMIPKEFHNRVYCMHFNNSECKDMAEDLGFNTAHVSDKLFFDVALAYKRAKLLKKDNKKTSN